MNTHKNLQRQIMRRVNRIYFVGIGGSGMCGIAEILHNQGYTVSGSDIAESASCARLRQLGIAVHKVHDAKNIQQADVVVVSTAISNTNPEVAYSLENKIPVIPRAEMLAALMRHQMGIAVAGTHGKTTTTSLLATIFEQAKLDPTYVIGGRLNSAGVNAYLGKSAYFIAEADESDASFLHLQPQISIVTNIEPDHMATYDKSTQKLLDTFVQFLYNLPFYGLAVICLDDPLARECISEVGRPVLTYGFSEDADYCAQNYQQHGTDGAFDVRTPDDKTLSVQLRQPGKHNALNATACIAVSRDLGIDDTTILQALKGFKGVGRRFEIHKNMQVSNKRILCVDDYGHHPTEIEKTLESARIAWPEKRIVLLFQPHRYSRTKDLYEDFVKVLSQTDILLLLDVYAAGEQKIEAADSKSLAGSIRVRGKVDPLYIRSMDEVIPILASVLADDDVLIIQGAGNIGRITQQLKRKKTDDTRL